jgi:hypothetical protein
MRSNDHETRFCSTIGDGLRSRLDARLCPRGAWAWRRVCEPWRLRPQSHDSPAGAAARHQRALGAQPIRGSYVGALPIRAPPPNPPNEWQDEKAQSMITRFAMGTAAVLLGFLLGSGSAYAQARMNVSPLPALGMTSPLGIPNAPVGQTGIPLGATELATPGVSPTTSGAAPMIGATCVSSAPASAAMGSPITGASPGTASSMTGLSGAALFDGGGMSAGAPGTCAAASPPLASSMGPGSSVGMVRIPLGSTELGGGGLSPASVALAPNPSAPVTSSLTPLSGMTPSSTPSVSAAPSTSTCATTQAGILRSRECRRRSERL